MRARFWLRQVGYDLRENLLFRPGAILVACGVAATLLPMIEAGPGRPLATWFATSFPMEPGTAQVVLGTLAGAMMTVVSVVYSILLVALSLASLQFSTRIVATFMRDRPAQNALGWLVGAFVFALLVLRTIRTDPPWVPVVSVFSALAMALLGLSALVWFIHHIARGIQANNLVDAIAGETERVIDAVFGARLDPGEEPAAAARPRPPEGAVPITAARSGYLQLVNVDALLDLARGGHLVTVRGMGQFVVEGTPLAWWRGPATLDAAAVAEAFDIGTVRTMQDDAEWGVRQIVDIGLKAISPAVNDPSTGATCVDHLARLCARAAPLRTPASRFTRGDAVVEVPTTSFIDLVRVGFEQLRQYARTDMAVNLRILRALADVAEATPHAAGRAELARQGGLAYQAVRKSFSDGDCEELEGRWARLGELAGSDAPRARETGPRR
jgi:uncharacterized membrane protein